MSYGEEGGTRRNGFVTLDIETAPQEPYVDPANYDMVMVDSAQVVQFTRGKREFRLEEDWLEERLNVPGGATLSTGAMIADSIRMAEAPLEATHVSPSLHATTCHIVQVSVGWRDHTGELQRRIYQSDQFVDRERSPMQAVAEGEARVVMAGLECLAGAGAKGSTIVSFNGKQFDIPLLRARAAILGLAMPGYIAWRRLLYPYSDKEHADLRLILSGDDRRARGTLQRWAESFGVHAEEHGTDVWPWVANGKWDFLDKYGMTEAQTLVELFERVRAIL